MLEPPLPASPQVRRPLAQLLSHLRQIDDVGGHRPCGIYEQPPQPQPGRPRQRRRAGGSHVRLAPIPGAPSSDLSRHQLEGAGVVARVCQALGKPRLDRSIAEEKVAAPYVALQKTSEIAEELAGQETRHLFFVVFGELAGSNDVQVDDLLGAES